jgi:hypothetical protein
MREVCLILIACLFSNHETFGQAQHAVTILGELSYISVGSDSKGGWKLEGAKGTVEVRINGASLKADTVLTYVVIGQPNAFQFTIPNVPTNSRLVVVANVEPDRLSNVSNAEAKVKVYVDQYMAGADFSAGAQGATATCEVFVGAAPIAREMRLQNKSAP